MQLQSIGHGCTRGSDESANGALSLKAPSRGLGFQEASHGRGSQARLFLSHGPSRHTTRASLFLHVYRLVDEEDDVLDSPLGVNFDSHDKVTAPELDIV